MFLLFFLLSALSNTVYGMARKVPPPPYAPGELIVNFFETVSVERVQEIVENEGGEIRKTLGKGNVLLIFFREGTDIPKTAERFSEYPEVRYAEPNFRMEPLEK